MTRPAEGSTLLPFSVSFRMGTKPAALAALRSMTQETKIVFDLSDIVHVRIECKEASCGGELLVPLRTADEVYVPEDYCPYCKAPWSGGGQRLPEFGFIGKLKALVKRKDVPFRLKFEMDRELER